MSDLITTVTPVATEPESSTAPLNVRALSNGSALDLAASPGGAERLMPDSPDIPRIDLFASAPIDQPDDHQLNEDPYIAAEKKLSEQLKRLSHKATEMITTVIERNKIDLRDFASQPESMLTDLAAFLQKVTAAVPELRFDQPGYDGNALRSLIDTARAPQFRCDHEAAIVVDVLTALNTTLEKAGNHSLKHLEFKPINTPDGSHTAVGVWQKRTDGKGQLMGIVDPWLTGPRSAPEVFQSHKEWIAAVGTFTRQETQQIAQFNRALGYNSDNGFSRANTFNQSWIKTHGGNESALSGILCTEVEYLFYKFFAAADSSLRPALLDDQFLYMRDRIAYTLEKNNQLTPEEKRKLCNLSIAQADAQTRADTWKSFQPFIDRYFENVALLQQRN